MAENKSIGAFWLKTSGKGNKYYSGSIEIGGKRYFLAMFKNNRKTKENQPDLQIFLSEKKKDNSFNPSDIPLE